MKEFLILFIAMSCSSTLVFAQIQEVKPHEASVPVHEMELTFKDFISWIGLDAGIRRIETGEVTQRHVTIISTVLRRTREVEMHRMRGAAKNSTYISPDGHREAVFDEKGLPVSDEFNGPSYNYFSVKEWPLSHFLFDTFPWLLFGNSPKDPTSQAERIHAFCKDFELGLDASLRDVKLGSISAKEQLDSLGSKETISIILYCLEEREAAAFFSLFENNQPMDDQKVKSILKKLESSLRELASKAASKIKLPIRDSQGVLKR